MTVTHHEVRFERNTVTGMWRARCTCLWSMDGTQEDVQKYAAAHDEWVAVEPADKQRGGHYGAQEGE